MTVRRAALRRLPAPLVRVAAAGLGAVVLFHRVDDPPGDPARTVSPSLGTVWFEEQLRLLATRFDVVPAARLAEAVRRRRRGARLPVALTFDDDVRSHVEVAAPLLETLGLPATFFLCGSALEEPRSFWWERLERAIERGVAQGDVVPRGAAPELDPLLATRPTLAELRRAIASLADDARAAVDEALLAAAGPDPPDAGLRAADVRALADAGFEIGFHTRRHPLLPLLDDEELARAVTDGRAELEAVAGAPLEAIAYPAGKADERVAVAAREAGFRRGYVARDGAARTGGDALLADRVVAPLGSAGELARHLDRRLVATFAGDR